MWVNDKPVDSGYPCDQINEISLELLVETIFGATSEYPATHALLKSTAPVVRGPQSAGKSICIY